MQQLGPIRTALFVPGNRPDRVDKACRTDADVVIIDLEDAVPIADKAATRSLVKEKIVQNRSRSLLVRVNALETDLTRGDFEAIIVDGLDGIMLPKVVRPENIEQINLLLLEVEEQRGIPTGSVCLIPLIESALAVENAFSIANTRTSPERLYTLAFGAADYSLDMGIDLTLSSEELYYPRSRIAVACRAADIEPPLDTPFMIDLNDRGALEKDIYRAKQLGFQGKLCIHPNQIGVCNAIFSPSDKEIEHANKVIEAFETAEAKGTAAIQLNGQFVDYPIVEKARRILALASRR